MSSLEEYPIMESFKKNDKFKEDEPVKETSVSGLEVEEDLLEKIYSAEAKLRGLEKEMSDKKGMPFYYPPKDEIEFLTLEIKTLRERQAGVKSLAENIEKESLDKKINSEAYQN